MGVPAEDGIINYVLDDLSINSWKDWSDTLVGVDIPDLQDYSTYSQAIQDFDSKGNTDKILAALATSSNPNETNNAAVVARAHESPLYGKGEWDLPAAGIVQMIANRKTNIIIALEKVGLTQWKEIFSRSFIWSSTEYNSIRAWRYNYRDTNWDSAHKGYTYFIISVHAIV